MTGGCVKTNFSFSPGFSLGLDAAIELEPFQRFCRCARTAGISK